MTRRVYVVVFGVALLWAGLLAVLIEQPGYTDAYYYFNAGQRLAQGDGLTDTYLWVYFNAPESLPGPSHVYWMPLASMVSAASMAVFGAHFGAAQVPSVLSFAGLVLVAFWLGAYVGGSRRHAWLAALLVMFSGFFTPFWTTTDTFALYGLVGALALIAIGHGRSADDWRWYAAGGVCAGLAHLARADGLLLVGILLIVAWMPGQAFSRKHGIRGMFAGVLAYLFVMLPWFARNMSEIGTPLPIGGTDTIWMRSYNELVNYPPGVEMSHFWSWGLGHILQSRLEALANNLGTFIAVETWIVLGPFALAGLWMQRRNPVIAAAGWYALALHAVMTLLFAFPGYRGGLFHSSAALLPFWAVTGVIGLDAGVLWFARRRKLRRQQAQTVFSTALIVLAVLLSAGLLIARLPRWNDAGAFYSTLEADLPEDAVVMINDPAALYYHTGLGGVVVPNADPDVVPEIAQQYSVTHLLLDRNRTAPFAGLFAGDDAYPFLRLIRVYDVETGDRRLYEIVLQEQDQ